MKIVKSLDGFKWVIKNKDDVLVLNEGEYTVRLALIEYASKDKVFCDVGAHVGEYTVRMSKYYKQVIAIEPNPEALEVLRENLKINNITNVIIIPKACGDCKTTLILYDRGGSSTFLNNYKTDKYYIVEVDKLDHLVEKVDVIKIDVEGYEEKVIRGAMRLIKYCKPIIVIEHHEFRGYEECKGMKERIQKLLSDYYCLCLDDTHYAYIPKEHDLRNYPFTVFCHWINKCLKNLQEGKAWYHGLPYTWWYGANLLDFMLALQKHLQIEDEWFKKIIEENE